MALCINLTDINNNGNVRLKFADDVSVRDMIDILSKFDKDLTKIITQRKYSNIQSLTTIIDTNLKLLDQNQRDRVFFEVMTDDGFYISDQQYDTNVEEIKEEVKNEKAEDVLKEVIDAKAQQNTTDIDDEEIRYYEQVVESTEESSLVISNYINGEVDPIIEGVINQYIDETQSYVDEEDNRSSIRENIINRLKSFKVKILSEKEAAENGILSSEENKNKKIKGYVSYEDNTIYITPNTTEDEISEVILHELTHTVLRLKDNVGDESFLQGAEQIKQLLFSKEDEILSSNNQSLITIYNRIKNSEGDDLINNVEELAVRALTNKSFADSLNNIQLDKSNVTYGTLWSKIIDIIRSVLNIGSKQNTLRSAILSPVVEYIDKRESIETQFENDISYQLYEETLTMSDYVNGRRLWENYTKDVTVNYKKDNKEQSFKTFDRYYLERIDRHVPKNKKELTRYDQYQLSRWDYAISNLEQGDLVLVPKMKKVGDQWHYEYKDADGNWRSHNVNQGIRPNLEYKTMYLPVLYPTTPYYNTIAVATPNSEEGGRVSKVDKSTIISIRKRDSSNIKKLDKITRSGNEITDEFRAHADTVFEELGEFRDSRSKFYKKDEKGRYVKSWIDKDGNPDNDKLKQLLQEHQWVALFSPDRNFQIKDFQEGDIVKISFKKWDSVNKRWVARDDREINARVNFTVGGKISVSYIASDSDDPLSVSSFLIDPEDVIELNKKKSNISIDSLNNIKLGTKLKEDPNWSIRSVKGSTLMTEEEYINYRKEKDSRLTEDKLREDYKKYLDKEEQRKEAGQEYVGNLNPGDAVLLPWRGEKSNGEIVEGFKWRKVLFASTNGVFVEEINKEGDPYPKYYPTSSVKHVGIYVGDDKKIYLEHERKFPKIEDSDSDSVKVSKYKLKNDSFLSIPIYIPKLTKDNEIEVRIAREESMRYIKLLEPGDLITENVDIDGKTVTLEKVVISVDGGIVKTAYKTKTGDIIITRVTIDNIRKIQYKGPKHVDYKTTGYTRDGIQDMFERKSARFSENLFSKKVFKHFKPVTWEGYTSIQVNNINDAKYLFESDNILYNRYNDDRPKYKVKSLSGGKFEVVALSPYDPSTGQQNELYVVFSSDGSGKQSDDSGKHIRLKKLKGGVMIDSGKTRAFDFKYFYTNENGKRRPKSNIDEMMLSARPGELLTYTYENKSGELVYVDAQILNVGYKATVVGKVGNKNVYEDQPIITVLTMSNGEYITIDVNKKDVVAIGKYRTLGSYIKAKKKVEIVSDDDTIDIDAEIVNDDDFEDTTFTENKQKPVYVPPSDTYTGEVPFYEDLSVSYEPSQSNEKPIGAKKSEILMGSPDERAIILKPSDKQPKSGLVLPIGISGSGKSTWINTLTNRTVISPDEIRKELTGNISDQSRNKEVFAIAKKRAIEALKNGKLVVFDATNLNTKLRNDLISEIEFGVGEQIPIAYKVFPSDPEISKSRIRKDLLSGKERAAVPDNVIDIQYKQYLQTLADLGIEPPPPINQVTIKYHPDKNHQGYRSMVRTFLEIIGNRLPSVDISVVKNKDMSLYQMVNGKLSINESYPMKDLTIQELIIPILDKSSLVNPDLSGLSIFEEYTDNRDEQLILLSKIVSNLDAYSKDVQDVITPILDQYKEIYESLVSYKWEGTLFDNVKNDPIFKGSLSELEVDITLNEDQLRDLEIIKEVKCLK
jgi:predicted kinase